MPSLAHQVEGAAAMQRPQRAAVPVGAHRDPALVLEHDPPGEIHRRHPALPEEMHPGRVQAEKPVLGEKRLRLAHGWRGSS